MTIRFSSPVVSRAPRAIPNVVSIAGIDPSGGAGLFADLKAFSALGAYGCGIVAALTAQNTRSVTGVHLPPDDFIRLQLEAVLTFPKYDAEEWKNVTKIESFDFSTLVTLWKTYNVLILHLLENMNPAALGHVWRREDKDISLEALIHDYFAHMELHRDLFVERVAELEG